MARSSRPIVLDSSDEEDLSFPDLATVLQRKEAPARNATSRTSATPAPPKIEKSAKPPASVRRRKLGPISDNTLLRGWAPDATRVGGDVQFCAEEKERKPRQPRVQLRSRTSKPTKTTPTPAQQDDQDEYVSAQEEVTITEDVSMVGDVSDSSEGSEFENSLDDFIVDDDDSVVEYFPSRPPPKPRLRHPPRTEALSGGNTTGKGRSQPKVPVGPNQTNGTASKGSNNLAEKDLTDTFSRLKIIDIDSLDESEPTKLLRPKLTPPGTPPKSKPGLVSPKKLPRIPATPHRPNSDMFWSQEFVDDWNDEHSPRKQLFPDPSKASPAKKQPATEKKQKLPSAREAKKAFEQSKHDLAAAFLQELDKSITDGKLSELAASTGGIKLIWTNKLNTTAGRANWKRETLRTPHTSSETSTVRYKHHASIELAEKVIDDEHRLLNVVAHEFCHLANFMVSGITTNPHGREFKAWAAKCSRAFGDRGIEVTTKHSYDIDFKYVWQCADCAMEYKRHSKSIHPDRHRCGTCKGELRQTKPVPRGQGGAASKDGGDGKKKEPSEYQKFMKEEMKRVREENPKSPQKDIMKMVASRWSQRQGGRATPTPSDSVEGIQNGVGELTVGRD
ncbi:SprT-like family-domain-containing protein [Echria macrotheca]|uniref:SprT-like family-domain-containing protein n=1 Tax=Echria macrotheca TaxID=438768 RepID=A0AAJ0FD45_9PEZI|nr:SprT-like family-domain-containing protein [Echria macrotheca]